MKARNLVLSFVVMMIAPIAMADQKLPAKSPLRADFNKMIDEGNIKKENIVDTLDQNTLAREADVSSEQKKVIDFVDVEVGWGTDSGTVVDRRFDSVSEPLIADQESSVLKEFSNMFDVSAILYGITKLSPEI